MKDLANRPWLMVLTDERLQSRFSHCELAAAAAAGGADFVQLRDKRERTISSRIADAKACKAVLGARCRLIVNDLVDLAASAEADGVHLGGNDLDCQAARHRLGPAAIIGRTANSLDEALLASALPVDYLGVGPVYETSSKANAVSALGLETMATICRSVEKPVIAIGGIHLESVAAVLATGVSGIAVLSAIVCSEDPEAATRSFRKALDT